MKREGSESSSKTEEGEESKELTIVKTMSSDNPTRLRGVVPVTEAGSTSNI